MFGYMDNLCPPVSAKFSCAMASIDCTPREEFRVVAFCDFQGSELCTFTANEGTKYAAEINEFMDLDEQLAEEYIKELGELFAGRDWESEFDWAEANVEWFYPGGEIMEEIASEDGLKHDIEQLVGVCGENTVFTNIFRLQNV